MLGAKYGGSQVWIASSSVNVHKCPFTQSSEVCIKSESVVCRPRHNSHALVLSHSLLKEVGLSLQGNVFHEVKWVLDFIDLKRENINWIQNQLQTLHCKQTQHNFIQVTMFTFTLLKPSSNISRSATNSMYCFIKSQFMPISLTGRAWVKNSCGPKAESLMPLNHNQ